MLERSQDDYRNFLLQELKTSKDTVMRTRRFPEVCKKKKKEKKVKCLHEFGPVSVKLRLVIVCLGVAQISTQFCLYTGFCLEL